MSEANLWDDLRQSLGSFGVLARIENLVDKGTPDVTYVLRGVGLTRVSGMLELKHVDRWNDLLRIKGLSLEQVLWHETWEKAGGRCGVLLRVGTRGGLHILMPPAMIRSAYERRLLREDALEWHNNWSEGFVPGRILRWLTQ